MTIKFIKSQLLKVGYYCDRNPRTHVVRVWPTSKGIDCPSFNPKSDSLLDYSCYSSFADAYRTIIVNHITF